MVDLCSSASGEHISVSSSIDMRVSLLSFSKEGGDLSEKSTLSLTYDPYYSLSSSLIIDNFGCYFYSSISFESTGISPGPKVSVRHF